MRHSLGAGQSITQRMPGPARRPKFSATPTNHPHCGATGATGASELLRPLKHPATSQ